MKRLSAFSLLICLFVLLLTVDFLLLAQEATIPDLLCKKIVLIEENQSSDLKTAKNEIVIELSDWTINQISVNSAVDVIQTLNSIMPVTSNEHTLTWNERKGSILSNNIPIKANLLSWNRNDKEVLAIRFDCYTNILRKSGYLESYPPIFIAKDKDGIYFGDLSSWKYTGVAGSTTYTFHGLVNEKDDNDFPDVVFSTGPVGSGSYLYFGQMHYDSNTKKWNVVWQTVYGYLANVVYSGKSSELKLDHFLDKFNAETTSSFLTLKWGGY